MASFQVTLAPHLAHWTRQAQDWIPPMTKSAIGQESFDFTEVSTSVHMDEQVKALRLLKQAAQLGWVRQIDYSLAFFLQELNPPTSSPCLILTVALLSYAESLGHTCLSIDQLLRHGLGFLGITSSLKLAEDIRLLLPKNKDIYKTELLKSPLVRFESLDSGGNETYPALQLDQGQPLVLCQRENELILYLRRHCQSESFIASTVVNKCKQVLTVDEAKTAEFLELLFPKDKAGAGEVDLDWQKISCALAARSSFTLITGGPGTGKTYTVSRLIALTLALSDALEKKKIALVAPTGKAASRLYRSIQNSLLELGDKLKVHVNFLEQFESIGVAKTLHSLLGARKGSRSYRFHSGNTLDLDVLVIDESSMISIELMSALLRALNPRTQLILLGDKNQLSSVEAGSVFGALCEAQSFELLPGATHLDETPVYGQSVKDYILRVTSLSVAPAQSPALGGSGETSGADLIRDHIVKLQRSHRFAGPIAQLASCINEGALEAAWQVINTQTTGEIFVKTTEDVQVILSIALKGRILNSTHTSTSPSILTPHYQRYWDLIDQALKDGLLSMDPKRPVPNGVGGNDLMLGQKSQAYFDAQIACIKKILKTFDSFRVLCAVNEGPFGVDAINGAIELGLKSHGYIHETSPWYPGKAIMLTRNQPELELSNGDVGLVLPSLDHDRAGQRLKAYFLAGDGVQSIALNRLDGVQTAYAMSIHKSQGSEFDHALLVLPKNMDQSLSRELLYTGITRTKTCLSIVQAQQGLIDKAIIKKTERESALVSRISAIARLETSPN